MQKQIKQLETDIKSFVPNKEGTDKFKDVMGISFFENTRILFLQVMNTVMSVSFELYIRVFFVFLKKYTG